MSENSSNTIDSVNIRVEDCDNAAERASIRAINEAAFGRPVEAGLVEQLGADGHVLVSLVAELDGCLVGHILFSRMWIRSKDGKLVSAVALAPMAVLPEYQNKGVGGRLVRYGLELLRGRGERIVIVVGHPNYYPRFGFSPERARSLESPFPPEAFMALELVDGALDGLEGPVVYPSAFGL